MKEVWKDIKNYEGLYQVSNLGNVKRLKGKYVKEERLVKKYLSNNYKYYSVILSKKQKTKRFFVHRLVAQSFLLNEENKPCVNHKDGNKLNNNIDNLEWCTTKENVKHSYENGLTKLTRYYGRNRKVSQYSLDGILIKEWECFLDIKNKLGFNIQNIWKCCNNKRKKAYNFIWKYNDC